MKTFKTLFGMMAVALMAASCSNDMNDVQAPEQVAKDGGIHFTATIAPKSFDATTRALVVDNNDNPTKVFSNWAVGEKILLTYKVSGTDKFTPAEVTAVNATTGAATIEATIAEGVTDDTSVTLDYPADSFSEDIFTDQDGKLNYKMDVRRGKGTIKVDDTGATLASGAKLDAKYAIVKFTVKDLAGEEFQMQKAVITAAEGETVATITVSDTEFYAVMPPTNEFTSTLWFEVLKYDATAYIAKGTANLEAGKFYNIDLKLATLGDLMNSDGSFSATAEDGKTPIGVIAYLRSPGADDPTVETTSVGGGHGLVLALKNAASGGEWSTDTETWQFGDEAKVADLDALKRTTNVSGYNNTNTLVEKEDAATNFPAAYKAKNYSATAPEGTTGWFLPSAQQWVKLMTGLGGLNDSDITWTTWFDNDHTAADKWETALEKAGDDNYDSMKSWLWYWSSSEYSESRAVDVGIDATETGEECGFAVGYGLKNGNIDRNTVRAVLAF